MAGGRRESSVSQKERRRAAPPPAGLGEPTSVCFFLEAGGQRHAWPRTAVTRGAWEHGGHQTDSGVCGPPGPQGLEALLGRRPWEDHPASSSGCPGS